MNAHEPEAEPWAVFERSSPGWFRFTGRDDLAGELFIRTGLDDAGAPVITGLALLSEPGTEVAAADLRELPLARIKASVKTTPALLAWAATAPTGVDPIRVLQEEADEGPSTSLYRSRGDSRARLRRPGPRKNEAFYRDVAAAYRHYVQHSNKPAVEISLEAGVPVATARRWINHARGLGLLDKGQRGRAI